MISCGGKSFARAAHAAFVILVLYMMLPALAFAEQSEEEKNFLLMYFKEEELQVVSSTRSLKSISRVAENMSVVTAAGHRAHERAFAGRGAEYDQWGAGMVSADYSRQLCVGINTGIRSAACHSADRRHCAE